MNSSCSVSYATCLQPFPAPPAPRVLSIRRAGRGCEVKNRGILPRDLGVMDESIQKLRTS
eukprot:767475-Hanusia_phi.AAC.1